MDSNKKRPATTAARKKINACIRCGAVAVNRNHCEECRKYVNKLGNNRYQRLVRAYEGVKGQPND